MIPGASIFHYDKWMQAFDENGLNIEFYNCREREEDEIFPWDFIDVSV